MLITLLVAILVIGLLIYLVQILPLPDPFKTAALVVVVILAIIWLVQSFAGGIGGGRALL